MTQSPASSGVPSKEGRNSKVRKTWLTFLITFFLGFPTLGLLYFWQYTHSTISRVGEVYAREALAEITGDGGFDYLYRMATLELRENIDEQSLEAWLVDLQGDDWVFERKTSYVEEREGRSWQVAEFLFAERHDWDAGRKHEIAVSRLTVLPDWRIERFEPAESKPDDSP